MNAVKLVGTMRPNFLLLTPVCVFLGYAAASVTAPMPIGAMDAGLILAGALLAHISVNMLNEYHDFQSGLDLNTARTPFSGGSGTLPAHPAIATHTLVAGVVALALTGVIGLYLLARAGIGLLPVGLLGLVVVAGYSPWITRRPLACLFAPGLGFGPLMVMGAAYVLAGHYSATAALASLTPLFLVSGLLLINQFPDTEPDREAGRRHLPIMVGRRGASRVFAAMVFAAFLPIIAGIPAGLLPLHAALGLLTLPLAAYVAYGAMRFAKDIPRLTPFLGFNVALVLGTNLLLAIGLLLGT